MATFTLDCPKVQKRKTHRPHSWHQTRFTLHGWVTDTYRCKGVKEFGR